MNNKLKQYLKLTILSLVAVLLTNSCQKDDEFQTTKNDPSTYQARFNISKIDKPKIEENTSLVKNLLKIEDKQEKEKRNAIASKDIYSSQLDFTIDTNFATYIESPDGLYHSYTFPISRNENTEALENLLVSLQTDGTYIMFLVTYTLTVQEKLDIRDGIEIDLENKVTFTAIEDNDLIGDIFSKDTPDCGFSIGYECEEVACSFCDDEAHVTFDCYTVIEYGGPCGGGGGVTGTGDNGDGSTSGGVVGAGGGTGDGTGLNEDPNAPVTVITPPAPTPIEQIVNCIPSILNNGLTTCLQENKYQTGALNDYLINNSCDTQAQGFGALAAQAICDGGKVDYEDKIVLDPSFTNNEKVKCVYDKLKGLSSTIFNDIINDHFDSAKNATLKFKVGTTSSNQDGETRPSFNSNTGVSQYLILLDSNFVQNASTIEIALTLIHESIHAELIERCVRLGLLSNVGFIPSLGPTFQFTNSATVFTIETAIFNQLLLQCNASSGGDWNHQFFNALSYRTKMAQNLTNIHPWLNDTNNDFLTHINDDPFVAAGPYTLNDLMDYLSWIGLEETQDYATEISGVILELNKKVYVQTAVKSKYTNNCN